jgi:hypothetical protein
MQQRSLPAFIGRNWNERARRGASAQELIRPSLLEYRRLRQCPFASVCVVLHSCCYQSLATVALRGEGRDHARPGIDAPRPLRGCCVDRLRSLTNRIRRGARGASASSGAMSSTKAFVCWSPFNPLNEIGYTPNNDDRTRAHILAPRRVRFVSLDGFVIAVPYARSARFPNDESPRPGSRCAAPLAS